MGKKYHDKICWQQRFGKNPVLVGIGYCMSFVLVSWWSVSFVSVVLGVLVALWWCVRSVVS